MEKEGEFTKCLKEGKSVEQCFEVAHVLTEEERAKFLGWLRRKMEIISRVKLEDSDILRLYFDLENASAALDNFKELAVVYPPIAGDLFLDSAHQTIDSWVEEIERKAISLGV